MLYTEEHLKSDIAALKEIVIELKSRATSDLNRLHDLDTRIDALMSEPEYSPPMMHTQIFGTPISFDTSVVQYWGPNCGWLCKWGVVPQMFLYNNDDLHVEIRSRSGIPVKMLNNLVDQLHKGVFYKEIERDGHIFRAWMRFYDQPWKDED